MSYFDCDAGKRYYPFGKGGRTMLMRGFKQLMKMKAGDSGGDDGESDNAAVVNNSSKKNKMEDHDTSSTYSRLTTCPFLSIPIIPPIDVPGTEPHVDEYGRDSRQHGDGIIVDVSWYDDSSLLPITISDPSSSACKVYEDLAKAVISEVYKSQLTTLLVSGLVGWLVIIVNGSCDEIVLA